MDETTTPVTPVTPEANGHAPDAPSEGKPAATLAAAPEGADSDKLQPSPEGREYLADRKWVNQQYNLGHWDQHMGNYIAVYKKQLLGFGPNPLSLREQVAKEHNLSPGRIVITYVDPGIDS